MSRIPLVSLQDVEHFYIVGSQYRDGILGEYNLKTDLKAALYPSEDSSGPNANGHEYVDLGLPSGTLWATMNVGATKPEEYGDYYAWGEVETKDVADYTTQGYRFYPGNDNDEPTKYNSTDNKMTLDHEDDAAHIVMGGDWYIPSEAQLEELVVNTTSSWTTDYTGTGVAGAVFTSNINGNSIFFPAAGGMFDGSAESQGEGFGVWSSSRHSYYYYDAWDLHGDSVGVDTSHEMLHCGRSVRGVLGELNDEDVLDE